MDFRLFLADMGPRPKGKTLDRIDNDGHYAPGNCRWATAREQASNTSRNKRVRLRGESVTHAEAARLGGVHQATIKRRLDRGYTAEQAVAGSVKKMKLTRKQAAAIRRLTATESDSSIALSYGVSRQMVNNIRRGHSWLNEEGE